MEYFFSLPKITDLTIEQQAVLYEELPIALSGGAGTGKSVVSIYRHLQNYNKDNSSILLTYTRTLEKYLFKSIKKINPEASKGVHSAKSYLFSRNKFDNNIYEIIIDEAQDLPYRDIEILKSFAKNVSYGADFNQQLYANTITRDEIKNLFPKNIKYHLEQNFRNTKEIINFTKAILPTFPINSRDVDRNGEKPMLLIGKNQINQIIKIIEAYQSDKGNIAILLPFSKDVDYFFNNLKDKVDCSYYPNETKELEIKNIHITTFKSSKGLEFDTVIIPNFHNFKYNIKNTMTYIEENDYYVAFTRAKTNLFLISFVNLNISGDSYKMEEF